MKRTKLIMKYFPLQNGCAERYVGVVKNCLVKVWRGGPYWHVWLLPMQISLNDRIISRHGSTPFSLMFARRVNTCRDYSSTAINVASIEELMERNRQMIEIVYPEIEKKSTESGRKYCEPHNKGHKKDVHWANGTIVYKKVDVREQIGSTLRGALPSRWVQQQVERIYSLGSRDASVIQSGSSSPAFEVKRTRS